MGFPNRKRNRLKDYDYSSGGYYFVTICIKERPDFFGKIKSGEMILNEFGKIVSSAWLDIPNHYFNCELDYFVIMPDHVHGIIIIDNTLKKRGKSVNYSLSEIIRGFKTFSSKRINEKLNIGTKFRWQKSFYDRIIRDENELYFIRNYIQLNPLKWDIEKKPSREFVHVGNSP
jgi:putative transposase